MGRREKEIPISPTSSAEQQQQQQPAYDELAEADAARSRCKHCGRGFALDRIDAHEKVCGKLTQARADLKPARVYDSATARMNGVVAPGGSISFAVVQVA